jgi:hypothetical protein
MPVASYLTPLVSYLILSGHGTPPLHLSYSFLSLCSRAGRGLSIPADGGENAAKYDEGSKSSAFL